MNVFDINFQIFVQDRLTDKYKESIEWKELNNEYNALYKIIYESLSKENQKNFNKFLNNMFAKNQIESSLGYKAGILDGVLMRSEFGYENDLEVVNDK